jgi:molybdopterin-guanine dinucleotide biosynthesis protein A
VLACDLPFAARLVARLTGRAAGSSVVAADADGRVQPLCARYPRARALAAAAAALAEGDHRVVEWARHMGPPAVEHAAGRELLNVNTADDLARARDHVR